MTLWPCKISNADDDGTVLAWGQLYGGLVNVPQNTQIDISAIACGGDQCVALKNGSIAKWGQWIPGDESIRNTSGITAIASGGCFNLALKDGAVLEWGYENFELWRIPLAAKSGVTAIACGSGHAIALKDGAVLAWGSNGSGQCLGTDASGSPITSDTADGTVPVKINGVALVGVTAIAGGSHHTIALKYGAVLAWGWNDYGQCSIPAAAQSGVSAIAGGYLHTIALKNGEVLAWGYNGNGQCTIPASASSGVSAIACGYLHSIALKNLTSTCLADLNQSGFVDSSDLGTLLGQFGPCPSECASDFNKDGVVDSSDLGTMLGQFGGCP